MKPVTGRGVQPGPTPPRWFLSAALMGLALVAGFLLLQTLPAVWFFARVTELLAILANGILGAGGYEVARTGVELRNLVTGHAIAVTAACDGSGLLVSAGAALIWFREGRVTIVAAARWLAVAALAIFVFNLVRVVVIFLALGHPELLHAVHIFIAPLLSAVLVALLVIRMDGQPAGRLWVWVGVAAALSILWYFFAAPATCAVVLPVTNFLISMLAAPLVSGIGCGAESAALLTSAATSLNPPSVMMLAFSPADFTLGAPLVAASLIVCARGGKLALAAIGAILLWALTMTLATMNIAHDQATLSGVSALVGESFRLPYHPPGAFAAALAKALQNALVHFNLLILPFIICGARPPIRGGSWKTPARRR